MHNFLIGKESHVGFWEWDVVQENMIWSDGLDGFFGNPSAQKESHSGSDGFFPCMDDGGRRQFQDAVGSCVHEKSQISMDLDVLGTSGKRVPVKIVGHPLVCDGRAVRIIGCVSVVKAHNQQHDRSRLYMFASMLSELNDSVILQDLDGDIIFWNHAAKKIYGWSESDALRMNFRNIVHEEHLTEYESIMSGARAGDVVKVFESRRKARDGSVLDVEVTMLAFSVPDLSKTVVSTIERDITRKKQEERLAQERNALFQLVSDHAGDILWTYDFRLGRYTYVSSSVHRFRGFTPEEILNQSLLDALTPESAQKALELVQQRTEALESGDTSAMFGVDQFDQLRKDGSSFRTEVMTTLIQDKGGKVTGIVGIARDITARLEDERQQREREKHTYESQKLESIGRIARGVAHELNNQLTPVIGYAEMLNDPKSSEDERHAYADLIYESALGARELVGHLLDFSRGRYLQFKPVAFDLVLGDMDRFLHSIVRSNITLCLKVPDSRLPLVSIDAGKIRQAIVNLVLNAQDAMENGGTLTLEALFAEIDDLQAVQAGIPSGKYVQCRVADTGTGIMPDILPQIYEPFFTTKKFGTASGLGLASVFGIVKQHQGHIHVDSKPGNGTVFTISLPVCREGQGGEMNDE